MNRLFSTLREKWIEYLLEVVVLFVGVYSAFALDRWNEKRIIAREFHVLLQQYYNAIYLETQQFRYATQLTNRHISLIDSLLANPDMEVTKDLVLEVMYLEFNPGRISKEVNSLGEFLGTNHYDEAQSELIWHILSYVGSTEEINSEQYIDKFGPLFPLIPKPGFTTGLYGDDTGNYLYSEEDIAIIQSAIPSKAFRSTLLSIKGEKLILTTRLENSIEDGIVVLEKIKRYSPELDLLIDEISVLGTALNGWEPNDVFMTRVDDAIWVDTLYLKVGEIKFRNRKSWKINWGGETWGRVKFPNGVLTFSGGNIPVTEDGNYLVTIDLMKNTYSFQKLDE